MIKRYHYVYRITNTIQHKHYYGSRTTSKVKEITPSDDLGCIYFSSSSDKSFIQDQKDNPLYYKYKIIKIFNTKVEAVNFEIVLHNRFNVAVNNKFYNKAKQTSTKFNTTGISSKNVGCLYNVYNHVGEIIYENLIMSDVKRINAALQNTCQRKRLGMNNNSKQSLNYHKKLHMVGWYIKSIGDDDTDTRVNFTEPIGRIYKPRTPTQIEKVKLTMVSKSKEVLDLINFKKGAGRRNKPLLDTTKQKMRVK